MLNRPRNLLLIAVLLAVLALVFAGEPLGTVFSGLFAGAVVITTYTYVTTKKD